MYLDVNKIKLPSTSGFEELESFFSKTFILDLSAPSKK